MLRSAFAVLLFVVVLVVVELRMLVLVGPFHDQLAFWPFLLLKLPEAHLPLMIFKKIWEVNILSQRELWSY